MRIQISANELESCHGICKSKLMYNQNHLFPLGLQTFAGKGWFNYQLLFFSG